MVAWAGYEPAIQVLTHDADLVAVLVNVRTVFAAIRLILYIETAGNTAHEKRFDKSLIRWQTAAFASEQRNAVPRQC